MTGTQHRSKHDQLHGGIPILVHVRVHGDRVAPLKRTVQRWPGCCNPIHRKFFFFLFTKPGWVPILPVDGMKGEGRMHAFGVGEREKGGRGVSTFCRAIITAVQCLSFIICNDPACLSPFPLNPHWAVREGSSSPTQPSCSRCRQAGRSGNPI